MNNAFLAKLNDAVERNNSLVCVGLDPDPAQMPIQDLDKFLTDVVEATADLVCCYKPNLAFFEQFGQAGLASLRRVISVIGPDIPVLADAKRGDIGNTAAAYAQAIFDLLGCDAVTVNAYTGKDGIEPFLEYSDKGIIVLCRSSNPSSRDFQDLIVETEKGQRMPLWQAVALKAREWNTRGNVGIVMGATYPEQLAEARELCPDMQILVPGIGAQEGSLKEAVNAGLTKAKDGIIVNFSRSVIYAERGPDYAMAARSAAAQMREQINRYRLEYPVYSEA